VTVGTGVVTVGTRVGTGVSIGVVGASVTGSVGMDPTVGGEDDPGVDATVGVEVGEDVTKTGTSDGSGA